MLTLTCAAIRRDHVATLTLTGEVADGVDTAAILTQTHLCQALIDVYKTNPDKTKIIFNFTRNILKTVVFSLLVSI